MSKTVGALALASLVMAGGAIPAHAQDFPSGVVRPGPEEFAIVNRNNTGGDVNIIIPRGPTGADTFTSDSAAGGNAGRPELAVPNGSGGGGGGNR